MSCEMNLTLKMKKKKKSRDEYANMSSTIGMKSRDKKKKMANETL